MAALIDSASPVNARGDERRPPAGGRRGRLNLRRGDGPRRVPWIWILPGLAVAVAIQFYPVVAGSYYAFTDWSGVGPAHWTGLHNFSLIFSDPAALGALEHTLELGVAFVVVANVLGLALAVGLGNALKSRNLLRAFFFAPVVLTPLATSYIWAYIFQYTGPLNGLLSALGLSSLQQTWLASPTWALWTILVVLVWQNAGLSMVIYLAGLQAIPAELDEAAAVDGASSWYRFRRVTLPMLVPAILINLTLTMVYGLRVFDQILALTNGGPFGASDTLATSVWKQMFVDDNFGFAAALALTLTVLVAIVAAAQFGLVAAFNRRRAR
jgi:raffinose/stachyose/melibiose transport system permease protein